MTFADLKILPTLAFLLLPPAVMAQDEDRTAMSAPTGPNGDRATDPKELAEIRAMLAKYRPLHHDTVPLEPVTQADHSCLYDVMVDLPDLHTVRATTVMFGAYCTEIDTTDRKWLDHVCGLLLQHPRALVRIEAHTDNYGPDAENDDLSRRRALAVEQYLLERGIAPHRLTSVGYGERFPVASNNDRAGRRRNRRVELRISLAAD